MMRIFLKSLFSLVLAVSPLLTTAEELYFPGGDDGWESVSPEQAGWDAQLLDEALELAGERDSSGVLILYNGRIMAERYWQLSDAPQRYLNAVQGTDSAGRVIEDVASAQKSVVAVITGIAQEKDYLQLDDPVSNYLEAGWSKMTPQQENAVSIRHLLSMNSGMATDLSFSAEPGSQWLYNTPAYHLLMRVVMAATGKDRHELTSEWITEPLAMKNSSWTPRPWAATDIAVGFSTTARDLARFGLMIQANGRWHELRLINSSEYIEQMLNSSQQLNPAYGYLWWLNGKEFSRTTGALARRNEGQLIASAPDDLIAMQGALDRKLYLVPSLNLIVTRLGNIGSSPGDSFNDAFWTALMKAAPSK